MGAIPQTAADNILNASLGVSSLSPTFTGSAKIALTSTAPTATSAGTELTGTGYSRMAVTFASAAAGSTTGPASTTTWTNGSGSGWTIVGLGIYDSAGSPVWWWYGTWVGQPISIAASNAFVIPSGGLTVTLA